MNTPTVIDIQVGKRLQEIRKQAGWRRLDVSAKLGIEPDKLRQYENGTERVSPRVLVDLARIFRIQLSHIFDGVAARPRSEYDEDCGGLKDAEEATLLAHFRRIRNAKTRALILSLLVAYVENEDLERGGT